MNISKNIIRVAAVVAMLPLAVLAADKKVERQVVVTTGAQIDVPDAPREQVTFLGVEAVDTPPVLAAQLKLPEGQGLVVNTVVPDSPAATAGLQKHDVLIKLDDQILINPRQLSVLVRGKKEGDKVVLTYVRGGAEAKVTVTLGKHEVPAHRFHWIETGDTVLPFFDAESLGLKEAEIREHLRGLREGQVGKMEELQQHLEALKQHQIQMEQRRLAMPGAKEPRVMVFRPKTNIVMSDDSGVIELRLDQIEGDGSTKVLVARDEDGNVIFNGPVATEEQRRALPEDLRVRLEKLESIEVIQPSVAPVPAPAAVPAVPAMPAPAAKPVAPVTEVPADGDEADAVVI